MSITRFLVGLAISFGFSGSLFWIAFHELAPAITNVIPNGEWKPLGDLTVYFLVAYCGGVLIPILILGIGILATIFWSSNEGLQSKRFHS